MEQEKRKRAAWRFDPKLLTRLKRFVDRHEPPTTQTGVIESALRDYLDRKEVPERAARR